MSRNTSCLSSSFGFLTRKAFTVIQTTKYKFSGTLLVGQWDAGTFLHSWYFREWYRTPLTWTYPNLSFLPCSKMSKKRKVSPQNKDFYSRWLPKTLLRVKKENTSLKSSSGLSKAVSAWNPERTRHVKLRTSWHSNYLNYTPPKRKHRLPSPRHEEHLH